MNIGKAIYGILSSTTAVTDLVSTKIFPEIAEQETATPFVIYQVQSVQPEDTHDGPSKLDEVRVEVLCYDDAYNGAADLASAVRGALDRVRGTYNGVNVESVQFNDVDFEIEYDPRRYSQVLTFTFRIKRDDIEIALGTPITGAQLGDLSDVNVTGATDNQILSYDAATDTWVPAADAGGPDVLDDLSDVDTGQPADGQMLAYQQGTWSAIYQDEITLPIASVTGLQAELNTIPDALDDLDDVKIIGTPAEGEALVYQSGFWSRGTAGASTLNELDDVQVPTPSSGAVLQYNGAYWAASALSIPTVPSTYYHQRYSSEAGTLRSGATETVELYYTAQADGDGLSESASSDTPTSGYDIRRKLWYAEKAQADPDTGTWTQFTAIADNTTFNNAKAALLAYLKERTGGTVPISLKMTWEEVAEAPSFTGLLNESYGSGAEAAYSTRRLNGNVTDCMVIRRASDSTTTTIGFDGSGNIDEAAITTFCTGTTCTVVTWKDQSGNGNDATQSDSTKQPTIYTGGQLVKQGGRLALEFDGTNDGYLLDTSGIDIGSLSSFTVGRMITISNAVMLGLSGSDGNKRWYAPFIASGNFNYGYADSATAITTTQDTNQNLHTMIAGTTLNGVEAWLNSTSVGTTTRTTGAATGQDGIANLNEAFYANCNVQEVIYYASDKSSDRTNIESNIGDYFTQNTPLLDTYTGAAAAYSLRKLRTAYTGSAIRVRRASDNTEQDIGFNVFGELDTVSLASFCSGTNGFVKTWFDQASTNDATQTTAANQPKIYDSVTGVVTENGKPAVQFDGSSDNLAAFVNTTAPANLQSLSADFALITVEKSTVTNQNGIAWAAGNQIVEFRENSIGSIVPFSVGYDVNNYQIGIADGSVNPELFTASITQKQRLAVTNLTSNTMTCALDGTLQINTTITLTNSRAVGTNNASFTIGVRTTNTGAISTNFFTGTQQELILYASDQSSNRTNIEDNINTFYSIY